MHFAITIDTEVDKSHDWRVSNPETYVGINRGVSEVLQPLFDRYGVKPVYFLSNEILADPGLSEVFSRYQAARTAELATHLHFEAAGPVSIEKIAGQDLSGIQAQLSEMQERQALIWLTEKFEERFGEKPASFRAGRYGLGANSIRLLAELGYRIDSSVTPGIAWEYDIGGQIISCDYRHASQHPYECAADNASLPGSSGILEVPVSLRKAPLTPRELLRLVLGKPRRWVWARPGFATKSEMSKMIRESAINGNEKDILVMMFHNMEVIPAASPYCGTEAEAIAHVGEIEHFIKCAINEGLKPITLRQYEDRFGEQIKGPKRPGIKPIT